MDEGYGEKTCIISGGLGTITVSHNGQTYYVCCTGCKAAFEDDPERWIARAEEQKE
ncbi:YHS domain-containing protein [bacterium]|nr:YHS domain-containing protein [bacterium]